MEVILYILFLLAITIFCLGIIGIVVFVLIRESKKVAAENEAKEKAIREEEAEFQNSKNEFLADIEFIRATLIRHDDCRWLAMDEFGVPRKYGSSTGKIFSLMEGNQPNCSNSFREGV